MLGPVEVVPAGRPVSAGSPKQCCVLAVLALEANRVVPVETITDRVWDHDPPPNARGMVQTYVSRLRRVLTGGTATIDRRPGGYLLAVDPDAVDLHRFHRHLAKGAVREALDLWRGVPLSGVRGDWAEHMRHALEGRRSDARRRLLAARMDAGDRDVLPELDELLVAHPLDEELIGLRMLALHRAGRQAEALACYREVYARLLDELGDEPGAALRELHQRLLRRDPALKGPPAPAGPEVHRSPAAPVVPRQLPPSTPHFVGRADELGRLDAVLDDRAGVVVVAVGGMAGVGKTTLAVHWARSVADRFPDGQLYLDLRGFDDTNDPVGLGEATRFLLDALGTPPERVPSTAEGRAALLRSLLADRAVLVVLDNARTSDQVRPLLPGGPGCLALVTSRNLLTDLIAHQGAVPVNLEVLSEQETAGLLTRRLGPDRAGAEPDALSDLVRHTARLPLAASVLAARAQLRPTFPLGALAAELRDQRSLLDSLDVRGVFDWSYRQLPAPAARLFRLLGLHPGPDVPLTAAAALAEAPPAEAHAILGELTDAHLLTEHTPGRFRFHDLLRAYSRALAEQHGPERDRAVRRLLDHLLATAYAADRLLDPHRDPLDLPVTPAPVTDAAQARAWMTTEHAALRGAIALAANTGHPTHAWQLHWCLQTFLQSTGRWTDLVDTGEIALAAARAVGHTTGQALAHRGLALAQAWQGDHDDAERHFDQALALHRADGDLVRQARTHLEIDWMHHRRARHREALDHALQALALYRSAHHRAGQAGALNDVGWCLAELGEPVQALAHCDEALRLHHELGNRHGQAATWHSIGYARHQLRHHVEAMAAYRSALALYRELDRRYDQAVTLDHLGDTLHATHDDTAASECWHEALAILEQLHHPKTADVRVKAGAVR